MSRVAKAKEKALLTKPKKKGARISQRARRVAQIMSERPGIPAGQAMREAGYSPSVAAKPHYLTRSENWNELLDEYLPQRDVLEAHKGMLKASTLEKFILKPEESGLTRQDIKAKLEETGCKLSSIADHQGTRYVYFFAPDQRARKDALDMVYKLRGNYAAEKHLHVAFSLVDLAKSRELPDAPMATPLDTPRSPEIEG